MMLRGQKNKTKTFRSSWSVRRQMNLGIRASNQLPHVLARLLLGGLPSMW